MDLFSGTITSLWETLKTVDIPIIDMPITDFLLGCLVLSTLVSVINIILGKKDGAGK